MEVDWKASEIKVKGALVHEREDKAGTKAAAVELEKRGKKGERLVQTNDAGF